MATNYFITLAKGSCNKTVISLGSVQAMCVTTHKDSWGKLLLCLISIVTRLSSHHVRQMDQTQGSKHVLPPFLKVITEESDLENFQDLIVALDAYY